MDMYARAQGNRMKPRISVKKSFGDGVLPSVKSLLHSRKELCNVSTDECLNREGQDNFIEITFIGFAEERGTAHLQELAAVSAELPDVLKSLQLCKLKEDEVIFLKDVKKTLAKPYVMKHQNQLPEVFCVMRLSPSFPRIKVDYIFTLLSKYTTGIRYAVEINSSQKHQTETSHGEDDDTNQSVSSIEDDFVTAFEHLDEDEPSKIQSAGACSFTSRNHRDAASQTISAQCLEAVDSKILVGSARRKSSVRSSTLIDILGIKELSSVKNSVTTSISDPWIQRSFYKPYNPSDQGVNFLCKTLFSSSPAESSESDCSSPSPIIFLDEEGYQKSLKAKLQLPKIPVMKDGIEDSDSECFSESKDCWQEQKGHRFSSKSPPPCSTVTFARRVLEDFTDTGSCSVTCLNKPSKPHDTQKTPSGPLTYRQADCFLHANNFSSVMFGSEDALQLEDKSSLKDGNTCVMPDTPPPTPLVPCQGSSERNLRKLSKKLKGELAKEFAPATPPSTPYNPSVTGLSETEHDSLENEEFMLKLMRSLSEEVESSEDEDRSEMPVEKEEHSEKTIQYADCLASRIISIATEMAASHLDGKTNEREADRQVQSGMQNRRCGYTAFLNIPEETCNSLWNYAGDMAGKVISEAKKIVKSRHCKLLRLKRVNCQVDCLYLRRSDKDYSSKERCGSVRDQWLGERDSSVLPLPQGSGMTGLTSKYPSCESVTDEYADHIIRVLKREGGNAELLMDQYASRLAYRSIKSGLQQAARKTKLRYSRKTFPGQNTQVSGKLELIKAVNKDAVQQVKSGTHRCEDQTYERNIGTQRTECTELLHFSESLARSITCDVRKKLKMSGACLPKSLTDSCLYKKTEFDEVTGDLVKTRFSRTFLPFSPDHKLYHSTGSLNENGYSEGVIQAIEQYARKVADDTLEMSLESAVLHVAENRKNGDRLSYTEKLSPFSGTVCRCCSMKEHRYCTENTSHHLPTQESSISLRHFFHSGLGGACQKSRVFQLDIPKIHVDVEQKAVCSDKGAAAAIEKAEGELSYTSLTADSGIGQDGVSFAESLTTEIMTSAMTNIGQAVNISSVGREGFHSVESIVSQQMSLSIGDDSTGSWSNLSFEDEHPDESSSFLHLSDSDGTEDKDEDSKDAVEGLEQIRKTLAIVNIDLEPNLVDPQLRAALQWLAASETEVSDLHFHDAATREFVFLSRRLRERDWKVGDLLQAVLKYCEMIEKASDAEQALNKSLVGWLLENV
ncbi:A-kinase anchor protein 11 isoform X5 [Egretta garzetta]|uniref:A-kinase anchor protein 11 isoform X5 n=1 Tax=Egretta garzetta TaxID=188379 RepID=UPI00163C9189|nr:A-kinase anchor protein 11 isoform X5 [Egretta garzetta]